MIVFSFRSSSGQIKAKVRGLVQFTLLFGQVKVMVLFGVRVKVRLMLWVRAKISGLKGYVYALGKG